ncbi:hypothetical protein BG005_000994 [Podila minutissima]|nr:hypothetical protein BG005_000994 [Podila minutissima]
MDTNQLEELSLNDNMETTTLAVFVDETRYLEIVAARGPQATIRPFSLVAIFHRLVTLQRRILDRVCQAIQGFLKDLVPRRELFVWKLCILTVPEIQVDLVGSHDSYPQTRWSESSTPSLNDVLSRQCGSVCGNQTEDDHTMSIKSASFKSVMAGIRFTGDAIMHKNPMSDGYYTGGSPSLNPQNLLAHATVLGTAATAFNCGLPIGYLVHPKMAWIQERMLRRPVHLQVSHNVRPVQILCGIGGYHHDGIAMTVGALVLILKRSGDP